MASLKSIGPSGSIAMAQAHGQLVFKAMKEADSQKEVFDLIKQAESFVHTKYVPGIFSAIGALMTDLLFFQFAQYELNGKFNQFQEGGVPDDATGARLHKRLRNIFAIPSRVVSDKTPLDRIVACMNHICHANGSDEPAKWLSAYLRRNPANCSIAVAENEGLDSGIIGEDITITYRDDSPLILHTNDVTVKTKYPTDTQMVRLVEGQRIYGGNTDSKDTEKQWRIVCPDFKTTGVINSGSKPGMFQNPSPPLLKDYMYGFAIPPGEKGAIVVKDGKLHFMTEATCVTLEIDNMYVEFYIDCTVATKGGTQFFRPFYTRSVQGCRSVRANLDLIAQICNKLTMPDTCAMLIAAGISITTTHVSNPLYCSSGAGKTAVVVQHCGCDAIATSDPITIRASEECGRNVLYQFDMPRLCYGYGQGNIERKVTNIYQSPIQDSQEDLRLHCAIMQHGVKDFHVEDRLPDIDASEDEEDSINSDVVQVAEFIKEYLAKRTVKEKTQIPTHPDPCMSITEPSEDEPF